MFVFNERQTVSGPGGEGRGEEREGKHNQNILCEKTIFNKRKKVLESLGIDGTNLKIIKVIYGKPIANVTLIGNRLRVIEECPFLLSYSV